MKTHATNGYKKKTGELAASPDVRFPFAHHVVGVEHFAQQLRDGTLGLHGGVALAQVHRHLQRALAVHQPGGNGQDALLHVGGRRQAAQLLEGHRGVLSAAEGKGTRVRRQEKSGS